MSVNKVNQSTGKLSPIAGGTLYADAPIGSIQAYGGSSAPWGWLLCQGQAISRTTYAELFNVIGTSFGSGDGSTTFNIPDLRGKTLVGYNSSETEFNAIGKTGGTKTVTLTVAQIPAHTHSLGYAGNIYAGNGPTGYWTDYDSPTTAYSRSTQANTGGGGAHNNLQPYNTVNYIIKATSIALPSDFEAAVDDKIADKVGKVVYQNSSIQSVTQTLEPNSLYLGTMYGGASDDGNYRFVELIHTGTSSIYMTFVLKAASHVSSSYELGTLNYTIQCNNTTLRACIYKLF